MRARDTALEIAAVRRTSAIARGAPCIEVQRWRATLAPCLSSAVERSPSPSRLSSSWVPASRSRYLMLDYHFPPLPFSWQRRSAYWPSSPQASSGTEVVAARVTDSGNRSAMESALQVGLWSICFRYRGEAGGSMTRRANRGRFGCSGTARFVGTTSGFEVEVPSNRYQRSFSRASAPSGAPLCARSRSPMPVAAV